MSHPTHNDCENMIYVINKNFIWFIRCVVLCLCVHALIIPVLSIGSCNDIFQKDFIEGLFRKIQENEIHSPRSIYVVGEESFNASKTHPLFIKRESISRVLNPDYYSRLVEILYPVFQLNRKGLIVAVNVMEAARLTKFLNQIIDGIRFEVYYTEMSRKRKLSVLNNSKEMDSHYMVVGGKLNKDVNLSGLSSYIDLNFNSSLNQTIDRINNVLSVTPAHQGYDILLLMDYRRKKTSRTLQVAETKSLLEFLKKVDVLEFDKDFKFFNEMDGKVVFRNPGIVPLNRNELHEYRTQLIKLVSNFYQLRKKRYEEYSKEERPSYEEAELLVQSKGVRTRDEFYQKRKIDSELARIPTDLKKVYKDQGWVNGHVFFGRKQFTRERGPSYEQAEILVQKKEIQTSKEYSRRRKTDPELQQLPRNPAVTYKGYGWVDWGHFLGKVRSIYTVLQELEKEKPMDIPYFLKSEDKNNGKQTSLPITIPYSPFYEDRHL